MRTIIAGSRSITSYVPVADAMATAALFDIVPTVVFSGAAAGVDTLGEHWARLRKLRVQQFPARWRDADGTYDPRAGFRRNEDMVRHADALVAVWDGKSRGTKHVIEFALANRLNVWVHVVQLAPRRTPLSDSSD